MGRCRRTDAIIELVIDPELGVDALSTEQREHAAICPDCHRAVEGIAELDRALTADLRSLRREVLPTSILDTPPVPRADAGPSSATAWLAAAAVVALIAVGIAGYGWWTGRLDGIGANATATPDASPVVSPPAPSAEPSATPVTSPTPAPVPSLVVGEIAAVVDDDLVVRTDPGTEDPSTILPDRLWIGQRVRVLDGPAEADEYTWWQIRVGDTVGWVADGEKDGSKPWLSPIANGRIAYSRGSGVTGEIPSLYTVEPDGSDEQLLADPTSAVTFRLVLSCSPGAGPAQWSHDGVWVAFSASVPGCEGTVYAVRADGSGLVAIGPGVNPTWRPDGAAIVFSDFVTTLGEPESSSPLLTVDPGASDEPVPLVDVDDGMSAYAAAWAPDRRTIAFNVWSADAEGGIPDLYLADGDGSSVRELTDGSSPVWSPDGRWIVFTVFDGAGGAELRRIRPDGSDEEALGPGDMATFSPDGMRIAYQRDNAMWTMAADGTSPQPVGVTMYAGHAWSPDGAFLVVSGEHAGDSGLHIMSFDGENVEVTSLGVQGSGPSWQPRLLDPRLAE